MAKKFNSSLQWNFKEKSGFWWHRSINWIIERSWIPLSWLIFLKLIFDRHWRPSEAFEHLKKITMNANLIIKLTQYIIHSTVGTDDLADRLNNQLTGILLIFFIGVLFIKQYIFKPIQVSLHYCICTRFPFTITIHHTRTLLVIFHHVFKIVGFN